MNVKLLRKVKKHILAEPKRFSMTYGIKRTQESPCGTMACIAGWAAVLSGAIDPEKSGVPEGTEIRWYGLVLTRAEEALGITENSDRLFRNEYWPFEFRMAYARAESKKEKAKIAAKRIEHFIKTKGRE